jgi:uncharacterized protein with PIN domain
MNGGSAEFRFYAELNDFLAPDRRFRAFTADFAFGATVKDAIEALGVPHPEVDVILANHESVDFSYRMHDGDRIAVYPVFESFDISSVTRLRPTPLRNTRFVIDANLGQLARYLRLLGLDAEYSQQLTDSELVHLSVAERRVLLTRDVGALKHGSLTHGYFVRARDARAQVVEVLSRFDLFGSLAPLSRCAKCNGMLDPVDKQEIAHRLEPSTRTHYDDFWVCERCDNVYWRGAHIVSIERFVQEVGSAAVEPATPPIQSGS